jgi:hypothetical protein
MQSKMRGRVCLDMQKTSGMLRYINMILGVSNYATNLGLPLSAEMMQKSSMNHMLIP